MGRVGTAGVGVCYAEYKPYRLSGSGGQSRGDGRVLIDRAARKRGAPPPAPACPPFSVPMKGL